MQRPIAPGHVRQVSEMRESGNWEILGIALEMVPTDLFRCSLRDLSRGVRVWRPRFWPLSGGQ
eukprot:15481025-Alexandrium_andersonii.AAC.1